MLRLLGLVLLPVLILGLAPAWAVDDEDEPAAKTALQALNDFIGDWKGTGMPEQGRPEPGEMWRESVRWIWRFKGDDAWLVMTVRNGKYLKGGELHYLPDRKRYQFTAIAKDGKRVAYEGPLRNGYLVLDHRDRPTGVTRRITMNSAAEGVRFIYRLAHQPAGRTLFTKDYQVACTKQGESLAAAEHKVECPVSGGLGKIPVSYKGVTYYVCCTGCRDAFLENPEKYVKEFEARKKK